EVSRTVVLEAYEQLLTEGFVTGRGGSGTYVADGLFGDRSKAAGAAAQLRLSTFGAAVEQVAGTVDFPGNQRAPLRYDFAYGRGDLTEFPFEAWRRLLLKNARKASARALDYGEAAGSRELREAIATHLRRARAVVCDASQVLILNGSQQALDLVARVLIERGDR